LCVFQDVVNFDEKSQGPIANASAPRSRVSPQVCIAEAFASISIGMGFQWLFRYFIACAMLEAAFLVLKEWSALEDDFRTFLLLRDGSQSVFQQFTV
jgi:hypothetical protein